MKRRLWAGMVTVVGGVALAGLVQAQTAVPVSANDIDDEIHFSMADADENGALSLGELERRNEEAVEVFEQSDRNADGELDEQEYASAREALRNRQPG